MPILEFLSGTGIWILIFIALFIVLGFAFTLDFFESLKKGDERLISQSKWGAVISLFIVLFLPILYVIYTILKLAG